MNLRKLLCGLLALSLLLTMAPAALMEADIQPAVEEVGGAIGADDLVVEEVPGTVPDPAVSPVASSKYELFDEDMNKLTDTTKELKIGDAMTVIAKGNRDYVNVWKLSSDIDKYVTAILSEDGDKYLFVGVKAGKFTVNVTDMVSGKKRSMKIKVVDGSKKCKSVKIIDDAWDVLTSSQYDAKKGKLVKGTIMALEADAKGRSTDYTIKWKLSNRTPLEFVDYDPLTDIATPINKQEITANSEDTIFVRAKKTGKVTITATASNNKNAKDSLKIEVVKTNVKKGIYFTNVDAENDAWLWKYDTDKKAFVKNSKEVDTVLGAKDDGPVYAPNRVYRDFAWKSSKKGVATVAKAKIAGRAKVTFKKAGTTKITVSHDDYGSSSFELTVIDNAPTEVAFVEDNVEIHELKIVKGQTATLSSLLRFTWNSVNADVMNNILRKGGVTFSEKGHNAVKLLNATTGKIKGTDFGTEYIWVKTFNGKEAYVKVTVE